MARDGKTGFFKNRLLAAGVALGTFATVVVCGVGATPVSALPTSAVPLSPARLLDTRPNQPTVDGLAQGSGPVTPAKDLVLQVTGRGGVPAGAAAVFLNLTAILPSKGTVLTVYPCDVVPKDKSNLNIPLGDIRANAVFAKLSPQGTVCIHSDFDTNVAVDVNGYVPAGAPVQSLSPARLLDTRAGQPTVDGAASGSGRVAPAQDLVLKVAGRGGVPADATAAFLNLTAILPSNGTVLTVYPCDVVPKDKSNLNIPRGDIRANAVFAKLSPQGTVCIHSDYDTDVAVDVNGYVPAGAPVQSLSPARLLDTRPGQPTVDGASSGGGPVSAANDLRLKVAGRGGVPTDASAAFLNLTAILPSKATVLTVYPCDVVPKDKSNLNIPFGDIRANAVFAKLNPQGEVCIHTDFPTDMAVDVNGYAPAGDGVIGLVSCNAITEAVVVQNLGGASASLTGYELSDAGRKHYYPLTGSLGRDEKLTLISGDNPGGPGTVRWLTGNAWNNTGDIAYLKSPNGSVTSVECFRTTSTTTTTTSPGGVTIIVDSNGKIIVK